MSFIINLLADLGREHDHSVAEKKFSESLTSSDSEMNLASAVLTKNYHVLHQMLDTRIKTVCMVAPAEDEPKEKPAKDDPKPQDDSPPKENHLAQYLAKAG